MVSKTRIAAESLLVGLVGLCVAVGGPIASGYLATRSYKPDIWDSYESVDHLQHSVSFGVAVDWSALPLTVAAALVLSVLYGIVRYRLLKRKRHK